MLSNFMFSFPCCDVRYEFRVKRCSVPLYYYLLCRRFTFYLYFLYLLTHTGVQHDFPVRWCWCHLTVTRRVAIVFCDFSKAFDKVWHRGLLHKMKAYGITGKLINWFKSYLKARRQKLLLKIILQHIVKYLQVFHKALSLASLIYYLYKWYCWQTYITEQTICRWHFVWLFKSGHNTVEKCYCSWFEWNGYMVQNMAYVI
jgi:hypothetical protein